MSARSKSADRDRSLSLVVCSDAGRRRSCAVSSGAGAAQTSTLTPQDYIDIQQLVSSYAYGLDGNTDNGATYANLFAPGGVFGRPRTEGRDNLAALANTQPRGANYVRHFITNHVIEPSPGGAIGREYAVIIDIGENGNPGTHRARRPL